MKRVLFAENTDDKSLLFYLSAEEYLARHLEGDYLLLWRVGPTVIFGRNQCIETEVNLPYCRENAIDIVQRKSGGGCVYADRGNLMISIVIDGDDKMFLFDRFISTLALFLRKQGYDAWPSGRNDILIGGRKVSGSAFYSIGSRNIIHSTLLCDVNMKNLQSAITPSVEKLRSKGIESVRQRVANLSDFAPVDILALQEGLEDFFCDDTLILSRSDIEIIGDIMDHYYIKRKWKI